MIINTNTAAMNTHRQMGINQDQQQSAMEKLSSGLRINKAGDDAAGLAISEKMRGQINGLDQASRNAQDGISMIQTAEGALDESHSILQRMRELSVQSANDTNVDADREELQNEVNQLAGELDRIADNTEFNTQNLLDGSMEGTFQIGANEGQNLDVKIDDMGAEALGAAGEGKIEVDGDYTVDGDDPTIASGTYTVQENADGDHDLVSEDGDVVATSTDDGLNFNDNSSNDSLSFNQAVTSGEVNLDHDGDGFSGESSISGLDTGDYSVNSDNDIINSDGDVVATFDDSSGDEGYYVDDEKVLATASGESLAEGTEFSVGGIDISSQEAADSAIGSIDSAIEAVSSQRSEMGAVQNRLEHTISNLDNSSENLSAAESRIRDADMAAQMMEQTQASVKSQAAQSMLAQANQQPQSVLQLLG